MSSIAFVMDQQVGLRTQALNLERVVAGIPDIAPTYVPIHYAADAGLLTRLPFVPGGIKGTLRGVREIRQGLGDGHIFDAILWSTWAAKCVPDLVATAPSFLVMDSTPLQMERLGEQYGYTKARARFLSGWKRRATDRLYERATHLFPWSEWVAQSLRNEYGVPSDKITVCSPGVDTTLYRPDPDTRPKDGVTRLLFVGGDLKRKGGDLLLDWAAGPGAALRAHVPWELNIVTRDTMPQPLPSGVVVHGALANNSPELVQLYRKCDLFVLPTRADVYSLVALEALASGLPVVISRIGGVGEIVQPGKTGLLIEPELTQISEALEKLLREPELRACMSEKARQDATARLDMHLSVGQMIEQIRQSVALGRATRAGQPEHAQ